MKITDLMNINSIQIGAVAKDKDDVLNQMVELQDASGALTDKAVYRQAIQARESQGSTGIGEGIAIPHAKSDSITKPALSAMVIPDGVEFDSLDGEPVYLAFMIAAPNTEDNVHLDVLSKLSTMLMDEQFIADLKAATSPEDFLDIINKAETARDEKEAEKEAKALATADATSVAPDGDQATKILAVTACPTGIAHTYMAAESLEKAADKAGVDLKVETNGSGGVKGRLTDAEIAEASAIIVAADKDVELARFDGKKVIMVKVADGIHKADELIRQAEDGDAPIYKADPNAQKSSMTGGDSAGRKIYKSLMNGVSHMLPFVIGGGILIAIAFLLDGANAGTEIFGVGNPASNFLKTVGGLAFGVMFPILAGYIAMAIGERPALMPGMVGGYLASSGFAMHFDGMPYEGGAVSGFFGALIAGFLAGYLVVGLRKLFDGLPRSLEGIKPILLYPVCSIAIIGLVMVFIVNPPMAVFNSALFDALGNLGEGSKLIFGLVLGGMMSIDFGGPINKAAYVFGTASVASGQPEIMAAVMIGGMVPPIAIAIATLVFKNKFTKAERQTTASNFVMGLSFITEGAIPFAASDPIRVIPSCAVGAAIAGGLSMIFNCSTPAPHGGIFVIALVEHPIQYVIALIIGSVISAVLLGTLKKKIVDE